MLIIDRAGAAQASAWGGKAGGRSALGGGRKVRTARRLGPAALAAAVLAAVAACGPAWGRGAAPRIPGGSRAAAASGAAGHPGAALAVAVSSDFPTLDPAQAQDTESISAIQLMYQPLFTYGADGQVVGLLASDWQWSADGLTLTVRLQPEAHFADGSPVTAEDVVFSLDRLLSRPVASPHALDFSALAAATPGLAPPAASSAPGGIQAAGPETVVFRLQQPAPYLPELLTMPSTSVLEQRLAGVAGAAAPSWWFQHSAGSGPYVLGPSDPGTSLQLAASPHYWRQGQPDGAAPEGPYAAVDFEIVSSPAEQLRLFSAGRLDLLNPAPPAAQAASGLPAGSRLLQAGDLGLVYLGFNTQKAPFNNPVLRQAVADALNKQDLTAAAGAVGGPAAGLLPPGIPGYDPALQPYPYAPDQARSLYAAGAGKPGLGVTLLTIAAGGTGEQGLTDGTAAAIQRDLDAVGFNVTIQQDSWQDYYRDLAAGRADLFQGDWLADYPDAQDFFFNLLDSAAIGGGNASFYHDPGFDAALATASAEADPAARAAGYQQLDDLVYNDLPLLPEFYTAASVLVQPWVRPDPAEALDVYLEPPLLPQLDRVWLAPQTTASP